MRYQFLISAGAQEDMQTCRRVDGYAARKISVVLRDILESELDCQALVDEHYSDEAIESIDPLWYLQDVQINAYRVRLINVAGWRLITVADHRAKRVGIFGVMPRDANYEDDRDLTARIERELDAYNFNRLR